MKSYQERENEKLIREFVGPGGQIDPMAATTNLPAQFQQILSAMGAKPVPQLVQFKKQIITAIDAMIAKRATQTTV